MSSSAPSPGGSFRLDLDHAPEAIKELEAAREELVSIKEQALALGKVDPGSADSVSIDAAAMLSAVAVSGPTSLTAALDAGIHQIDELIISMSADLRDYQQNEAGSAATF